MTPARCGFLGPKAKLTLGFKALGVRGLELRALRLRV